MGTAGSLAVKLIGDIGQLKQDMTAAGQSVRSLGDQVDAVGKKMQDVGKKMTTFVTAPILAFGTAAVFAFDKQAQALAQVEQGVKSTGQAAGFTAAELAIMASELQKVSRYGDEDILQGVTAQLLTFTNIANEQFASAQVAVLDLATRMKTDLKSAAIQLGKALNDPITGLSMLGRSGITFTETQKELIKTLWETGRAAEAQNVILAELNTQFGGSAEAALAGAGKIVQLKNDLGDFSEELGRIIFDYIEPFIDRMREWVQWFKDLDEQQKKNIVQLLALAAAIGPVIFMVGKLITTVKALTIALSTNPIYLFIAAVAALTAAWASTQEGLSSFGDYWREFWIDLDNSFRAIWNGWLWLINQFISGLNILINTINLIPGVNIPGIGAIGYIDYRASLEKGSQAVANANQAIADEIATMNSDLITGLTGLSTANDATLRSFVDSLGTTIGADLTALGTAIAASGAAETLSITDGLTSVEKAISTLKDRRVTADDLRRELEKISADLNAGFPLVEKALNDANTEYQSALDEHLAAQQAVRDAVADGTVVNLETLQWAEIDAKERRDKAEEALTQARTDAEAFSAADLKRTEGEASLLNELTLIETEDAAIRTAQEAALLALGGIDISLGNGFFKMKGSFEKGLEDLSLDFGKVAVGITDGVADITFKIGDNTISISRSIAVLQALMTAQFAAVVAGILTLLGALLTALAPLLFLVAAVVGIIKVVQWLTGTGPKGDKKEAIPSFQSGGIVPSAANLFRGERLVWATPGERILPPGMTSLDPGKMSEAVYSGVMDAMRDSLGNVAISLSLPGGPEFARWMYPLLSREQQRLGRPVTL